MTEGAQLQSNLRAWNSRPPDSSPPELSIIPTFVCESIVDALRVCTTFTLSSRNLLFRGSNSSSLTGGGTLGRKTERRLRLNAGRGSDV